MKDASVARSTTFDDDQTMKINDIDPPALLKVQSENRNVGPSSGNDEVSVVDLLIVLGRRKKFIIRATLIVCVAATLISLMVPNRYTAETTLLTPQQSSSSSALLSQLGSLGSMGAMAGGLSLKNPADMYVSLLKSRTVEDAMIQRFQLMARYKAKLVSDARKKFEENCSIEANSKDGLIKVSIEDRDPRLAAEIANSYIEEYRRFSANLAVTEASQRRLFFEKQLEQSKENLASAEEEFKLSEQTSGMIQLDSQSKVLIEAVASLRAQIVSKEVQISAMAASETSSNPEIVLAKEQLTALQAQLKQLGGAESSSGSELIVPRGKIPAAGLEYARKLRDVKYYETIFELMAKQYEIAKLDEAKQGSVIQVVDPAVVPDKKTSPKRAVIVFIASFITLCGAAFAALLMETLSRAQNSAEQRERLEILKQSWLISPRAQE